MHSSIRLKILLVSVLCMLVPLISSNAILTSLATGSLEATEKESLEDLAREKANALEDYIDAQKILTKSIASNSTVIEACSNYLKTGKYDAAAQETLADYLAVIQEQSGNLYENLFITAGSAGYADCVANEMLHDVADENFYLQCLENGYFFGNNVSPVTGNPVYVIAYTITDTATGEIVGTVNNSIDLATMADSVVSDDTYDVKLLDLDGIVIASPDVETILVIDMNVLDPESWADTLAHESGYFSYTDPVTNEPGYTGYVQTENFVCEIRRRYSRVCPISGRA